MTFERLCEVISQLRFERDRNLRLTAALTHLDRGGDHTPALDRLEERLWERWKSLDRPRKPGHKEE